MMASFGRCYTRIVRVTGQSVSCAPCSQRSPTPLPGRGNQMQLEKQEMSSMSRKPGEQLKSPTRE